MTSLCRGESGSSPAYGVVVNISVDGVCLLTDQPLTVGQDLVIELSFPEHPQTLQAPGRAVWIAEAEREMLQCGLQFTWPKSTQTELRSLIHSVAGEC